MIEDVVYGPNCLVSGSGLHNSTAGEIATFYVQLADYFGNNITDNLIVDWTIIVLHTESNYNTTGTPSYLGSGIFAIVYNATVSGDYTIDVQINDTGVGLDNPYPMIMWPSDTYAPTSSAAGGGLTETFTDEKAFFSIVARDRYKNLVDEGGINWNITVRDNLSGSELKSIVVTDFNNGTYHIEYSVHESGEYVLAVQHEGLNIIGSPFLIKCKWGKKI